MTTRETIQEYFDRLREKEGWESLLDDFVFTSMTSPIESVAGKDACLHATRPFYSTVTAMEVRDLLVDGERACLLTRYQAQPSDGAATFQSDVAEIFSVRDGKIAWFSIYFDQSPYRNREDKTGGADGVCPEYHYVAEPSRLWSL